MRPMRYALAITAMIILALVLWANRFEYFQWENHILRVNRLTGTAEELRPGGHWSDGTLYGEYKAVH